VKPYRHQPGLLVDVMVNRGDRAVGGQGQCPVREGSVLLSEIDQWVVMIVLAGVSPPMLYG